MSEAGQTGFSDDDIRAIMGDIWGAMLGLPIEAADGQVDPDGREFCGCIQLSGAWEGAFVVRCPESLARTVTAAMLGLDVSDASDEDVRDAIGEVANMAAGNFKGVVGGDPKLSLPTVTEGVDLAVTVPGTKVVSETIFACDADRFSVVIVEKAA